MHVFRIWGVLCVLSAAGSSICVNEIEDDDGFADGYGNEISLDQQQESSNTPYHADLSHWDKLFIALEDSHMRQNMLQESVERCCGGTASLRSQLEKLLRGASQQSSPSPGSACRAQAEREALGLHRGLAELRRDGAEMEGRINATLQAILRGRREDEARLSRLEEAASESSSSRSRSGHQATQRPGGSGRAFSSGLNSFPSELEEQDLSSQVDLDMIRGSLVVMARDVQRLYQQLTTVIEQAGTLRKGRGDT
ncbi:uncharacterized protein LOC106947762 [Poecilia latipinna]|uniref:uncharacterized protein LOC106947762 n=1 Tax=Poecilia latipinna TaxID=48699 RepID=UPI00072E6AAD|nr:PREDICTED: uncharacterized protein LOC106947762 [Poecilia latipinna]